MMPWNFWTSVVWSWPRRLCAASAMAAMAAWVPSLATRECGVDDRVDGGVRNEGRGDRGGEDAGGFEAKALLVAGGEGDGLVIGGARVAGVHDADGRDVHRGAAVDHVADAALAGIDAD